MTIKVKISNEENAGGDILGVQVCNLSDRQEIPDGPQIKIAPGDSESIDISAGRVIKLSDLGQDEGEDDETGEESEE